MAIKIISVKEKKGEYQGKTYHNFNIYGLNPESSNPQIVAGAEVKEFKIKADNFVTSLGRNFGALNDPNLKTVKDIIGLLIDPVYDEWGNMQDFTLTYPKTNN